MPHRKFRQGQQVKVCRGDYQGAQGIVTGSASPLGGLVIVRLEASRWETYFDEDELEPQ